MAEEYNVKNEKLGNLINKMIDLAIRNPEVITSNNSDSDSILYQECRNEINRREKYFRLIMLMIVFTKI